MKYVKTFENFNYDTTNEGWLWGEGSIWSKIGNWISKWKDKKIAEGADAFKKWSEKNPEKIEELKSKLKPEFEKLTDEQKEELVSKLESFKGEEPPADVVEAAEEVVKVEEKLNNLKKGTKIYESNSLILEKAELSLGKKILYWLGLSVMYLGIIMMALAFILYFSAAIIAATGAAIVISPWLILGAFVGGIIVGLSGFFVQYGANPDHPDNRPGRYKTGWESSGGPIM